MRYISILFLFLVTCYSQDRSHRNRVRHFTRRNTLDTEPYPKTFRPVVHNYARERGDWGRSRIAVLVQLEKERRGDEMAKMREDIGRRYKQKNQGEMSSEVSE